METKEELFEELRREMINTISYREGIPDDIQRIVKNVFEQLTTIFDEYRCNNSTIEMFCDSEFSQIKSTLNNAGMKRIDSQLEQLTDVLNSVQRDLEQGYSNDELRARGDIHMDELAQIGKNNSRTIDIVLDGLDEALRNIRLRQTRILEDRGFSERQIDEINEEITDLARRVHRRDEEMEDIFDIDADNLQDKLKQKYNLFLSEATKSKEDSFRESLYAGISLEEQSENAKQFIESIEDDRNKTNNRESLPPILE